MSDANPDEGDHPGRPSNLRRFARKARCALTPRSATLKSKTVNGATLLGENRRGYGGRGIYVEGAHLEQEVTLLPSLLDRDGVFVDIGANTGIYTLTAAQHFRLGQGIVVALEPNVRILAMLARSCDVNGLSNVRLRALCASDDNAAVRFFTNFQKPNSFSMEEIQSGASHWSALGVTLDSLVTWESLGRLDYIKIDAEGSEARIISGGSSAIRQFRPIIQVEDSISAVEWTPRDYSNVRLPGSHNHLMVPVEHPRMNWLADRCARIGGEITSSKPNTPQDSQS